jgi:hypothetical protein
MLMSPAVLALNGVSLTVSLMMLMAAGFALQLVRHWDITSGSERQLGLERRTYLISTLVTWCFAAVVVSLPLFVYNAEQMATQFTGAMCATGVLNAHPLGWPTLFLKMLVFFAGATWLMLNRLDNQAPDYPLVRVKYWMLLGLLPIVGLETGIQFSYFLGLDPDVITSCCGSLFSAGGLGVAATVSAAEPAWSLAALYGSGLALLGMGTWHGWYARHGRSGLAFSLIAILAFVAAIVGIVSAVALYIYEHPQHHCPFCILKGGHGFMGYWLYLPLFTATALALGVGVCSPWGRIPSLRVAVLEDGRRFTTLSMALFGLFYGVATYAILTSNLRMQGVWW